MAKKLKLYSIPALKPVNVIVEAYTKQEAFEIAEEGGGDVEDVLGSGGEIRLSKKGTVILEEYDDGDGQ